ncbi:ABC transport system, permease component YbhR [Anaerovibrio sp. JC8]|uniref:ABC transporter permease n=1 Tax=Anaerovibrio sp. JC8 TaxID=1240085 RepID=UPI000A0D49AC|nr:ABC transporter permease [Anaerovibrio sp. JC8]ORU00638.1 ABC transport system, permease component YbhR [Anaerovibrio sp. JC8]
MMNGWKYFIQQLKWMIRKELLSTLKDPKTRAILVVPVFVQSLIFGYVATYDLDHVPYALLDLSHSQESTQLIAKLDGSAAFQRVRTLGNSHEIADCIDSGEAMLVLTIPSDFSQNLSRGYISTIQVITDGRNTMTASLAQNYIGSIVGSYNASRNNGLNVIQLETVSWYNPNFITRWNFLPALVIMLSLVQVLMLGGLSVAREREQGTFDQLLVTPLSPVQILIGKAVAPMLIGLIQSSIVLLICIYWFEIPMAGDLFPMYLTIGIFIISCTGIGLSISAISKSMQQVMVYCFVLLMPMVLLSGLATPVNNMPELLQLVTYADPMRFALDAVRRIYLEGAGFLDVWPDYIPMLVVACITMPLAGWLFRNNLQ